MIKLLKSLFIGRSTSEEVSPTIEEEAPIYNTEKKDFPVSRLVKLGLGFAIELDYGYDCAKRYVALDNKNMTFEAKDLGIHRCIGFQRSVVREFHFSLVQSGFLRQ